MRTAQRILVMLVLAMGASAQTGVGEPKKEPDSRAGTTWNGLRFGMTMAEVKAVLKDTAMSGEKDPGYFSIGTVTVKNTTGKGELTFGNPQTLERVFLDFSRYDEKMAKDESESVKRVSAYQNIAQGLLEKYGAPAHETGYCPTAQEILRSTVYDPHARMQCAQLWKESFQTIKMDFSWIGSALFLSVEYKPIPSDL